MKIAKTDAVVGGGAALIALSLFLPYLSFGGYDKISFFSRYAFAHTVTMGFSAVFVGVLAFSGPQAWVKTVENKTGLSVMQLKKVLVTLSAVQFFLVFITSTPRGLGLILGFFGSLIMVFGLFAGRWVPALAHGSSTSIPQNGFAPFWFGVTSPTPAFQGAGGQYLLEPGNWYLASGEANGALVVEHETHGKGELRDQRFIIRA